MAIYNVATATEFQNALDVVNAGDEIVIDHTVTLFGEFFVRNRGTIPDNNRIIIRGGTPSNQLPGAGYRMGPSYSSVLAKVWPTQSVPAQNQPALHFERGANGYLVKWIEFGPNYLGGSYSIIIVGNNDPADSQPQTEFSYIPYNITFDQINVHGHPISGQHAGITICADNFKLLNSSVWDCKGYSQDSYAVNQLNSRGPIEIRNCWLEGAAYSFIDGGTDPQIKRSATVSASPAATTTGARLSSVADMEVGRHMAFHATVGGTLKRLFTTCRSVNVTTKDVTFDAISQAPDNPGNVQWGVQLDGLTFRRNFCTKNLDWFSPIIGTPTIGTPVVTGAGTGFGAGTWYSRIQALHDSIGYQGQTYYSALSTERTSVLGATSTIGNTTAQITNATKYRFYFYQKDGGGAIINGKYYTTSDPTVTFTADNTGGTAFSSFPSASYWQVKNIFELKSGINWTVTENILRNHWTSTFGDTMVVWLKNNNQDGGQAFTENRDGLFEWNWMDHCSGGISISGQRATGESPSNLPERMSNIIVRNNLMTDSDPGTYTLNPGVSAPAIRSDGSTKDLLWDHNTWIHKNGTWFALGSGQTLTYGFQDNEKWRSNMMYAHGTYGFMIDIDNGQGGVQAKAGLDNICNSTETFDKNALADGTSAYNTFPSSTNYIPTAATFQSQFKSWNSVNLPDWRLKRTSEGDGSDSIYINLGHDGKDIGCDVATLITKLNGVEAGTPENLRRKYRHARRLV